MIYYALKSALLLTLLYGGFSALLSRETFHRFNRVMLLGIVVLSLVLPAVHITISNNPLPLRTHPLPLPVREGSEYTQEQHSADGVTTPLPHIIGKSGQAGGILAGHDTYGDYYGSDVLIFFGAWFKTVFDGDEFGTESINIVTVTE